MTTQVLFEFLREVPMFSDLSDSELSALVQECGVIDLDAGTVLFEEGAIGDAAYVVRSGRIDILKRSGNRDVLLSELRPGDLFGEMALLDDSPRMAGARARIPTTVIAFRKAEVQTLLKKSPAVQNAMFDLVLARLKATEARLRQSERMVQLGTLSAGIAHELNNPAAAAKRSSSQLAEAVTSLGVAYSEFAATNPDEATLARARELIENARMRALDPADIDAFDRSDAESAVGDWLNDNGVQDAWNVSCDLVTAGYTRRDLEVWAEKHEAQTTAQLARLVASVVSVSTLLSTVEHATGRISDIVDALKSYSFLDRAPIQWVNVADGIEHTLSLLASRLGSRIRITRDFEAGLPEIEAFGSDLNQVWTNLLNNAKDAIEETGEIGISAERSGQGGIVVRITDSGHGIPADIQARIFDAFFTTREPGQGTGLGLHATYDIVVNKHHGDIAVESEPGRTTITVELPARQEAE